MKTKITILFILVSITAMLLTGCSSAVAATVTANNGLSSATTLALGTLKLEGTSNAVTSQQAAGLLTLWEGYKSLSSSDTTSTVEMDALVKQIKGVMTSDQLQAIEAMNFTEQSVSEVMQSLGGSANASAPSSTPSSSTLGQAAPGGGPGVEMPGGGGDSVMSAIGSGMSASSTPAATKPAASTQNTQVNAMLLNALIQLLETRSQTTG